MSIYDPLLAIAKYSPSNEKLNALMAYLVMCVRFRKADSSLNVLACVYCPCTYPFVQVKDVHNRIVPPRSEISGSKPESTIRGM